MTIGHISNKGQITLPAGARRKLGIKPKAKVEIEVRDDEIVIRPLKTIREVRGIFRDLAQGGTEDWETVRRRTEQAIAKEVADEDRG